MDNKFFRLKRLKAQTIRFAPVLFLIIAFIMLLAGISMHPALSGVRSTLIRVLAPAVSVVSAPIRWMRNLSDGIGHIVLVYRENEQLRSENIFLKAWKNAAVQLAFENEALKKTTRYVPMKEKAYRTVRVLADDGGLYSKSKILAAGVTDGLKKGQIAVTENGLAGRITDAGAHFSRMLMLTDYLSRVPVLVGSQHVTCILSGDNAPYAKLILMPEGAEVYPGDVVLTAGTAHLYPSGLPVGEVSHIEGDNIFVRLYEHRAHYEFVRIVDFGFGDDILAPPVCSSEDTKE